MNKPKILVVENAIAVTGGLLSIVRSCQYLRNYFTFTFVVPMPGAAKDYILSKDFEVYVLPMKEIRKDFFSLLGYFPALVYNAIRLSSLVKRLDADLIVSNDLYNLVPATYKFFGGGLPYIVYVRFLPSKFPQALVRVWCYLSKHLATATIAVSRAVMNELNYQKNVVLIGGELPEIQVEYVPSSATKILYLANFIEGKGQESALESFALLCTKYPAWKLRFVGGDMGLQKNRQFKAYLFKLSNDLGISQQVEWAEFEVDISREYSKAAIVLNFSESESFSLTCLEAQYYGRPVVATRCGGPSEIIDHNESGIMVDLKDIAGMAKAIEYLINHPAERELMGKNAYQRVRERFSYENTVGRLKKVYDSALLK
ncbi:MAG: glycosyltransferase family 4 protein [Cyclobacteriaceae bacterium]|nr:glycosyltransferase family 4 protein [Cyclobacteriaceae bacterium]